MSWITAIWSATAAVCLTLAGVHFLVWVKSRASWANLLFSIAAASAAACAVDKLAPGHAPTPTQFSEVLRWVYALIGAIVLLPVWFLCQHLRAICIWPTALTFGLLALILGMLVYSSSRQLFAVGRVDAHVICAALCLYLIIDLVWGRFTAEGSRES